MSGDPSMPDGFRGDPSNPIHQFERELYDLVERYADVRLANPEWFVAYFLELADSYRDADDVDLHVDDLGGGVHQVRVGDGDLGALLNAPRTDPYGEIDTDALADLLDVPVDDGPVTGTPMNVVDPDDPGDGGTSPIRLYCTECGGYEALVGLEDFPTSLDDVDEYDAECPDCGGEIVAEPKTDD